MVKRNLYLLIFLGLVIFSCVPNRKLVYLQDGELKSQQELQTDSVTNEYPLSLSEYVLRSGDIVSVKVGSIEGLEDADFIRLYTEQLGIIRSLNQYNQALQLGFGMQGMNLGGGGGAFGGMGGQQGGGGFDLMMLTGFEIMNDGNMDLPYIREVQASGKTLAQLEEDIEQLLVDSAFMEAPIVRAQLMSFHFTIVGEVTNEGRYTSYDPYTSFFDAITLAGNLTEFADRSHIKVVRMVDGRQKVFYINLLDERFLASDYQYLYPGDLIVVSPLPVRMWNFYGRTNTQTALSILSSSLAVIALVISLGIN